MDCRFSSPPGSAQYAFGQSLHDGAVVQGCGLRDGIFGKWHLGEDPQSLPTAHGFDEFYGIPPDTSWNDALTVSLIMMTHSFDAPESVLIEKGPWIMQQKAGGPMQRVKPFTPEVRAEIDNDLTDRSIAFMKQQQRGGQAVLPLLALLDGTRAKLPLPNSSPGNRASVITATR